MRATIAVIPILPNRKSIVLAIFQIAPLRTFAVSERGFFLAVG
jgi:hypothetical protein